MKKLKVRKVLSALLAICMMACIIPITAIAKDEQITDVESSVSENFYSGSGFKYDEAPENAVWSLGQAESSLIPEDFEEQLAEGKKYYNGGNFDVEPIGNFSFSSSCIKALKRAISNNFVCKINEVLDDMRVRVVVLDDGTNRGATVFAVVDCIGISNKDIRTIREKVAEKLGGEMKISSINISATHSHSCIDTQGLWTNPLEKIKTNITKKLLNQALERGADQDYMEFLFEKVSDTIKTAYEGMETGTLTFAKRMLNLGYIIPKDFPGASISMGNMNRFVFYPDNTELDPTMIVNMAAHPYFMGLATVDGTNDGDKISGDYIYYMGETVNDAGYNFVFFNGAITGIYSTKDHGKTGSKTRLTENYGNELGKIAVSMTLTEEEIKEIYSVSELRTNYLDGLFWCWTYDVYGSMINTKWTPSEEITLDPLLNTINKEVKVEVTNPIIKLAGKLNLVSYNIVQEGSKYYVLTEIGYMELGDGEEKVKIALLPGELCQDLVAGGRLLNQIMGETYEYPTIKEMFCEKYEVEDEDGNKYYKYEDIIAFGLTNDAIGYVIPDNSYLISIYHAALSLGKSTASTITKAFMEIAEEIGYVVE